MTRLNDIFQPRQENEAAGSTSAEFLPLFVLGIPVGKSFLERFADAVETLALTGCRAGPPIHSLGQKPATPEKLKNAHFGAYRPFRPESGLLKCP
jgi:hypothetical protein